MSNVDVYRKRATQCQRQADAAVTKSVRETLRNIADKYWALAADEERSGAVQQPDGKVSKTEPPDARG